MLKKGITLLLIISLLSGCSDSESSQQMDYDQTKKMVVDILKTDDGKKAIREVMDDEEIKQNLVMNEKAVTSTIEKTLVSEKAADFWKKEFQDPEFAETMAKSMKTENEKLIKNLMKDSEYRKMMVELLQDPSLETEMKNILKSTEYREHIKQILQETMETPEFKSKFKEMLDKAAKEASSSFISEKHKI
ncbi:spore germination lipoprotein GerD [Niallia sp. Sow4_A1]|jgi:spore germination protein D|uniref:Spore germination lipoprotein GerD n=1 Tax=Niallia hominis TaxID=3133173 RepID=A0ABV1EX34_9BACI|nr:MULTISPECIES: spore germination lipoprotein GerD [Bacillaceae]MCF2648175.1 spore gernimation protein GerD [Niallia circulans]MCM3363123.1 spore germination lipoprotein GerD [Niallia sp. MER TA 168]CAI9387597.1 Spore germination protein GerD [Bacillus sp. T2.9-1]